MILAPPDAQAINSHYNRGDLITAIFAALRVAGKRLEALTIEDLAPVDQFHIRGQEATRELACLAGLKPGMQVLDVGGGLGGPARTLASGFDCSVMVLDLTEEYCRLGTILTAYMGLSDRISFTHGSALAMPFANASFDLVWTQHVAMNIADKGRFYRELYRILRPGARLALHEIMAGSITPIHFPVPWAREPSMSFLYRPQAVHTLLTRLGFNELAWIDETAAALAWFKHRLAAIDAAPERLPPLGLHLLLGADFREMFQNLMRNLQEGRIAVVQGVFERG